MAFTLSSKVLLLALSFLAAHREDLSYDAAKNQVINQYQLHNAEQELGTKKTSFEISEHGFIRYRKDLNNRSEYYSVKLSEFKDLVYLGDEKAGWLILKFVDEAVIFQTYNDKSGNVDEMLNEIKIPLKNISINDINTLSGAMHTLKNNIREAEVK